VFIKNSPYWFPIYSLPSSVNLIIPSATFGSFIIKENVSPQSLDLYNPTSFSCNVVNSL